MSFLDEVLENNKPEVIAQNSELLTREKFEEIARITLRTKIPPITPSITISDTCVCTEGGILVVSGQKKAGKSHGIINILATALMKDVDPNKTLNIRAAYTEKTIIYIDSEQTQNTTQDFIKKIQRVAGLKNEPKNLVMYNLTPFGDYQRKWEVFCDYILTIENLGLVVIDGIADFVKSVNDEEKGKQIVDMLLSKLGSASLVVTIHEGKDNLGATGHVGQIFEKKCTGTIAFFKDRNKGIHTIKCKMVRSGADFEDIQFIWCNEVGGFRLLDENEKNAMKEKTAEQRTADLVTLFKTVFGQNSTLTKEEIQTNVRTHDKALKAKMLKKPLTEETIKKNIRETIKEAVTLEIIEFNEKNIYNFKL